VTVELPRHVERHSLGRLEWPRALGTEPRVVVGRRCAAVCTEAAVIEATVTNPRTAVGAVTWPRKLL
jgi:hypothetical protein